MLAPTEAQVTEAFAPVVALLAQTLRKGGRLGHDALPEVDLTDEEQQALLY
jgi:hypothetical protein